jgi:hypothetical protein
MAQRNLIMTSKRRPHRMIQSVIRAQNARGNFEDMDLFSSKRRTKKGLGFQGVTPSFLRRTALRNGIR